MPRDGGKIRARLQQAALDLYGERGFEQTTTAQIAERAGVTERTYFRHFPDKREVLFDGEIRLSEALASAVAQLPEDLGPLDTLHRAFLAVEGLLQENRAVAMPRHMVIARTPALRERELTKIASLTSMLASLLQTRGTGPQVAALAAQVGMAAFTQATVEWLSKPVGPLSTHLAHAMKDLRALLT